VRVVDASAIIAVAASNPESAMNVSLYLAFLVASALLILSPGPTVMLVTSTSLRHGKRAGLVAVAGSTLAACVQLLVVVGGLASIITLAGSWFELVRWAGVGYLTYLGVSAWLGSPETDTADTEPARPRYSAGLRNFARGFVVTLTNPKTLLFQTAFLPQFVDPGLPHLPQMTLLAGSFIAIAGVGDSAWALLAARVGRALASVGARRVMGRVSGSALIGAGVLLALVRRND
jgi:threonine/homoserine/homoserine lactone efflux protein